MKHVITLQQAIGRSEPIECSLQDWLNGDILLVFASGVVVLHPRASRRDGDLDICEMKKLDITDYPADGLVQAGICTYQEIEAHKKTKEDEARKHNEARDRHELARLHSIYGGKP